MQNNQTLEIVVKASAEVLCDYLEYGINSILFQRGVYPPTSFTSVLKYGLPMYILKDDKIKEYFSTLFAQIKEWIKKNAIAKISLIIVDIQTRTLRERWDFRIECLYPLNASTSDAPFCNMRNVLKQIVSAVGCLPDIEDECSFDVQVHLKKYINLPSEWEDAPPANVKNAESLQISKFSTNIHELNTRVIYNNEN